MTRSLVGLRVLVVEDESVVALLLEDMLHDLGCVTAAAVSHVDEALKRLELRDFDLAVLDVNVAGARIDPVARRLSQLNCPFVFATGYGAEGLPPAYRDRPVLTKPFRLDRLRDALAQAVAS